MRGLFVFRWADHRSARVLVQRIDGDVLEVARHRGEEIIEVLGLDASADSLATARSVADPAIQPPCSDPFVSLNRAIGAHARLTA